MMAELSALLDFLILAWLVATWFYEGHHKRCRVEVVCPTCHQVLEDLRCASDRRHALLLLKMGVERWPSIAASSA